MNDISTIPFLIANSWLFNISYFLSLQDAINKRWEETLTAASQDLPTEKKVETGEEIMPSEGEGDSPAHQSLEEALFGWAQVLEDSDKLILSLRTEDSISPSQ